MLPARREIGTVVVCEDDPATLELLCDHLTADRYEALGAANADDALRLCRYKQPDLMVLDLGLPDASGLDVLHEIRCDEGLSARFDPELPIIVLTGRGGLHDRVRGLDAGADDYLIKPFHYPELVARIGSLLRRNGGSRTGPRRIGELVIDPARRTVRVAERNIELSNKEFLLLRTLATDPTRVFTKEELLREIWGYRTLGQTRTLDSHASRLRRKLDPEMGRYIVNSWGVGYRLVDG